jgi:hypothetical protein
LSGPPSTSTSSPVARDDDVVALLAPERVGHLAAAELVVAGAAVEEAVAALGDEQVVAVVSEEQLTQAPGGDDVPHRPAVHPGEAPVAGRDAVHAVTAGEGVRALVTVDDVVAGPALDRVVALAGIDRVDAGPAVDRVRVLAAVELVVLRAARDGRALGACVDPVGARVAEQPAPDGVAADEVALRTAVGVVVRAGAGLQRVDALVAEQDVGVGATEDGVTAWAAADDVVSAAAVDGVDAASAVDDVAQGVPTMVSALAVPLMVIWRPPQVAGAAEAAGAPSTPAAVIAAISSGSRVRLRSSTGSPLDRSRTGVRSTGRASSQGRRTDHGQNLHTARTLLAWPGQGGRPGTDSAAEQALALLGRRHGGDRTRGRRADRRRRRVVVEAQEAELAQQGGRVGVGCDEGRKGSSSGYRFSSDCSDSGGRTASGTCSAAEALSSAKAAACSAGSNPTS